MFAPVYYVLLWIFPILQYSGTCLGEALLPYLSLYTPGDPEYTDVIVRRVGDNLTLVCELKGDATPRIYVWNYVPSDNLTDGDSSYKIEPKGPAISSRYTKRNVQTSDSGHYICSAPEWRFSISKYILVQNRSGECAKGALWCGTSPTDFGRCVLAPYVCDGYADCVLGQDESPALCRTSACNRPDKLNCSSGRCISEAACCRPGVSPAACRQPACCLEHPRYARLEGWGEPDYPALFEDRHAPDEYGFIQSTIYTVTACALIFMIAVVLLVSAICKMHMKRAALRSYTARPLLSAHYNTQAARFPPRYEAANAPLTPLASPAPLPQYSEDLGVSETACGAGAGQGEGEPARGFGLARLSALFAPRYTQVQTENPDVELRSVPPTSPRNRPTQFLHYRSPTSCDLNSADFFFNPEVSDCGRDLNYMATPLEFLRERQRPLTLQLGRFQLSIPRLGRRRSLGRRPDTPNVTELDIEDLDFVRLTSNDTYTLNGRTIRLLGADFENYPALDDTPVRPPPYTDTMRYKLFGPPPQYLSRDCLSGDSDNGHREQRARSNVEMPPCYDELSAGNAGGNTGNTAGNTGNTTGMVGNVNGNIENVNGNTGNALVNIGNADGSTGNAVANVGNASGIAGNVSGNTENVNGNAGNALVNIGNAEGSTGNAAVNTDIVNTAENIGNTLVNIGNGGGNTENASGNTGNETANIGNAHGNNATGNVSVSNGNEISNMNTGVVNASENAVGNAKGNISNVSENIDNTENNGNLAITVTASTKSQEGSSNENDNNGNENTVINDFISVINDLPPIDSDVNANGTVRYTVSNENNGSSVNNNIEC